VARPCSARSPGGWPWPIRVPLPVPADRLSRVRPPTRVRPPIRVDRQTRVRPPTRVGRPTRVRPPTRVDRQTRAGRRTRAGPRTRAGWQECADGRCSHRAVGRTPLAGAAAQAASGSKSWCRPRGCRARRWRPPRGRLSGRCQAAPRTAPAAPRSAGPGSGRARPPPRQTSEQTFEDRGQGGARLPVSMRGRFRLTGRRASCVPYGAGSGDSWQSFTVTRVTLTCAHSSIGERQHEW